MGRPPKNPPKEPKLKTLVEDLGAAGCMMIWKGRRPFFSSAGLKTAELWQVWAGAVDSTPRSRWLNFDPETTRYPGSIEDTETKMLAILSGDLSEGLIAGDPREIIDETHGDDEGLTRQEAARLIYDHWRNDHAKLLGDALTELKRVREQRKQLYGTDPDAAAAWLDSIRADLPENSSVLEIDDTKPRINNVEVRRRLFLRPVLWSNVCRGGYAERPLLRHKLMQDFEGFLDGCEDCIEALQIPVFWIGGRSGDGKSVLLMQLCHLVRQAHPSLPIIHFHEPDALIDWIETSGPGREVSADSPLILAVVDDLHKVTDWERAQSVLEKAATAGAKFALVTCGPNPERNLFVEQSLVQSCLALHKCDSTKLATRDLDVIADHLGIKVDTGDGSKPTLVERVFLTLAGEASIDNFAKSLRERFNARVERDNLLVQLTAMAWLDQPLPRALASFDEASWLEVLAEETQLHISVIDGDFFFGHPAIARPIFEALTRTDSLTLTTRIARILSGVLGELHSPLLTTRILRQIMSRLGADAEVDVTEVLDFIFNNATGARVKAAAVVFIIQMLNQYNEAIRGDWLTLARTYRGNASLDPQIRASLAKNLVVATNGEEADLRKALDFVASPELGTHMGSFLSGLPRKSLRERGWTSKGIPSAAAWVARRPDQPISQPIIDNFLSAYPNDTRLRAAAVQLVRTKSPQTPLTTVFLGQIAKSLEDQLEPEIRSWLAQNARKKIANTVLTALIKKPGNKWDSFVLEHLNAVRSDDPGWLTAAAELLPHIRTRELSGTVLQMARENVHAPANDRSVGGLFARLAERAVDLSAEDVVCDRLDVLWERENLTELEGQRQACLLLGTSWGKMADRRDSFPQRVQKLFDWLSEIEREASKGKLSNARKRHRSTLRHSAGQILRWYDHAPLCVKPALAYYEAFPRDDLSGMAVAQLVFFIGERTKEMASVQTSELLHREQELLASCWAWTEDTKGLNQTPRVLCAQALIATRWNAEADKIRKLVWDFWYPDPQYGADRILQSYLRKLVCQDEAWGFLLDQSVQRASYDRIRAKVVGRNINLVFDQLKSDNLQSEDREYLLNLLEAGIGDWETNPTSAWIALQQKGVWPQGAETAIWRGILRSALQGFTLREEDYRPQFDAWHAVNRDHVCDDIIAESEVHSTAM